MQKTMPARRYRRWVASPPRPEGLPRPAGRPDPAKSLPLRKIGEAPAQEPPFGFGAHHVQRPLVRRAGLVETIEPAQEISTGRMQIGIVVELEAVDDGQRH